MNKAEIKNLKQICDYLRTKYGNVKGIDIADKIITIVNYAEKKLNEE
jgi:hypothetical protein